MKIIIASNPFGYGPTGQAIAFIKELLKYKYIIPSNIYFLGSTLCCEIVEKELLKSGIRIHHLDERNISEIAFYLENFKHDTVCIGFQNRFIIEVANNLHLKSIFIDGLGWFWDKVPESHLLASKVYWTNFPNLLNKNKKIPNNISIIGLIQDSSVWTPDQEKPFYLVSLGGCTNPLTTRIQENYLILAIKIFDKISKSKKIPIKIALGNNARKFLEKNILIPKNINLQSFEHTEMMLEFSKCKHHFSVGGQSSTMEALQSKIPTTFYLPSNLSQIALQKIFKESVAGNFYCLWEKYINNISEISMDDEAYTIEVIDIFSKKILENEQIIHVLVDNCILAIQSPEKDRLFELISSLRSNGAKQIISYIFNIRKSL